MGAIVDAAVLSQILSRLRKHEDAYPFLKPVEWKKLGLDDYPVIITQPMDLQTLGRKVRDGTFNDDLDEFKRNLQLIWQNCKTYNDSSTEIYTMAKRMESFSREVLKEYIPQGEAVTASTGRGRKDYSHESKRRRTQRRNSEDSLEAPPPIETPETKNTPIAQSKSRGPGRPRKSGRPAESVKEDVNSKEEILTPLSAERQSLIAKFLIRCKRLTPKHMAQIVILLQREKGQTLADDVATVTPSDEAPSRGKRLPSELLVLHLRKLADQDLRRLCSVMKLYLFKQALDERLS